VKLKNGLGNVCLPRQRNVLGINFFQKNFLVVLGFELRAYTLSYYMSPIFVMGFSR
jgi:hypothetical protein